MSSSFVISFLDFLLLSVPSISVNVAANKIEEKRKLYNDNLSVDCPGCAGNTDCTVIINGATMDTYTIVNGTLSLPASDWNVYGNLCCGNGTEETIKCYHVFPS